MGTHSQQRRVTRDMDAMNERSYPTDVMNRVSDLLERSYLSGNNFDYLVEIIYPDLWCYIAQIRQNYVNEAGWYLVFEPLIGYTQFISDKGIPETNQSWKHLWDYIQDNEHMHLMWMI